MRYSYIQLLTDFKPTFGILFLILALCFMANTKPARAQDPQFSQFYANPLYLNPAFTGATGDARVTLNYRNQWPGLDANFVTYAASYDQYVRKFRSGIGIQFKNDQQGAKVNTPLMSSDLTLYYSYLIPVNDTWAIQAGLAPTYGVRNLNYNKFLFGDQIDDNGPTGNPSMEDFAKENVHYFDFAAGVLIFTESLWMGFSAHHMNEPNLSFTGGEDKLPIKGSFHAGVTIPLTGWMTGKPDYNNKTITPTVLYKFQGKSDQLSVGAYFNYNPIVIGAWYRGLPLKRYETTLMNQDAFALLVGLKHNGFQFGYSYDVTINDLFRASAGSHEISLVYNFTVNFDHAKGPRKSGYPRVTCPSPWRNYERLRYRHVKKRRVK
ncbi:type IX secretion system membrane protein PorP/SprF [Rapidithrix thailandica]|uniref:Type IX secretion system membrane protein PorP/SprF n=1 Tax=Rapidithrix thailandica TaxID=413964 RepID=A0AAW9SIT0_9BACT